MEQKLTLSHDALDRFVATVIGWCERAFTAAPERMTTEDFGDVAFSDEWERKQIARELHWN